MADTDIKIKLTADPKPVRDAIKLIDRDLKELGGSILTDDLLPPEPPTPPTGDTSDKSTEPPQTSSTSNSERTNQNQRDRTNRLILRELIALRRELQKTNQSRSANPPNPPSPTPPSSSGGGPTPPPPSSGGGSPGDNGGSGSNDNNGGNNRIVEAIGKLGSLWSLLNVANSMGQQSLSRESLAYKTYGSLGVYDEYNQAGRDAVRAGERYGYNYDVTMAAQKANMRYAGFANLESLQADSQAFLQSSKMLGIDPTQMATTSGRLTGFGTFKVGEQQKFANLLAQSIQEHGMHGREDQELQVLQSISENLASRNTTVTEDSLRSGMNIYSALATINPNLRGERGGNLAEKMINIAGQDNQALDIMAGFGTEYLGIKGRQELRRLKEEDPQTYYQKIYERMVHDWGEENADVYFQEAMHNAGLSQHESDDALKMAKSKDKFDLSRDTTDGESLLARLQNNYESDQTLYQGEQYEVNKKSAEAEIGNLFNNITAPFKEIFNDMSLGGQTATTAAMTAIPAIGGGLLMSKLGGLASGLGGLGSLFGGAGGAGGSGSILSTLLGNINAANAGKLVTGAKIGGSVLTGGIAALNTYDNLQKGDYRGASESAAGGVGAIYGGIKGAGIGAGIGTAIGGPIGTILGGLIGGGIGAFAGNWLGEGVGGTAYDILGGSDKDNHLPEENSQGKTTTRDNPEIEISGTHDQNPRDRFDTRGMRTFTSRDQAQIIQQTEPTPTAVLGATQTRTPLANEPIIASSGIPSYAMSPKPSGETLLAQNPALMDSRGGNLLPVEKDKEDDDTRGTLERQFRLMEQDTRSTVENTKALEDNTKALEKKNKNSIIDKILSSFKGSGGTPVSTTTPVVTPVSPTVPTSPSQTPTLGSKVNNPPTVPKPSGDYNGEGGGGEGTTWKRQGDWVSFEGAQDGMMDAIDMLGKFFQEQTGHQLVVTAATNGDHPSNGTAYGHDAGYKFDINDWGGGGEGSITTDDGSKGWFVDQMIAYGRSLGLGMNWEGDHLDVSLVGDQWDGNGENAGGFRRPTSHAHGKDYVPYDNYPALLHKGERVLTRLEANELRDLPGVHLPPELQIDEDNDSISDRKQKRAAQEQYQYDSSHTQTNLSVIPGLRQMAIGGNVDGAPTPTSTMLQPGDPGYEVQQKALRKRAQQVQQYTQYAKEHKTNRVPGLNPSALDFQSPPKTPAAPRTSEWDRLSTISPTSPTSPTPQNNSPEPSFGDWSPTVPTGLELLFSLRSQTDELGNMLYGTDSGYNKITDNDTKEVARLKRLAQLRNTSTTDTLSRYYLTHPSLPHQTMSLPSPKPKLPTAITPEAATETLPETKPKQKFRPLRWLSKMWKSVVQNKQNRGIWSSLKSIIRGKGGPEQWLNLGTEIFKATQRSKSTRHQSIPSDPLSTLQGDWFNADGTPNLDSGLWQSKGVPKAVQQASLEKLPKDTTSTDETLPKPDDNPTDESTMPLDLPKDDSPDVPKGTEDTSSPAPKKKKPNILQWLQSKDTAKIITQVSKYLGGKHQKTLSKIGAFLGGLSSTSSGLPGLQDSMFKKDGTPNLDSGAWRSPGWPQLNNPTDESTTPLDLPKDTGHPNNPLSIPLNKENPIPMLNQTPPIPSPSPQQTMDGSSADMNANSISVELTVHVDGKIDGMNESNQGTVVAALVSRFKQPDWLSTVSNGYMRRANR